jgi:hypothetical protein
VGDDIVERLRNWAAMPSADGVPILTSAADEIERLRAAGDALALSLADFNDPQDALRLLAWKEACRG